MKVFRILFGWLANRWVISVLGILLLALLIWFVAPLIAFAGWEPFASAETRAVTIGLIVIAWLVKTVWTVVQARKTDSKMIDGLASAPQGSAEDQASEEEVAVLRDRFKESLSVLKKAKLGGRGGRRRLYQLPWYVIIGPPGAGKTTALRNSGLKFPLMDRFGKDAIQGVGGTRNCDWWFTDEAVLLDTAGRYTTQDSDQAVDSAAWGGFLQLLRKHRRRRPIDGVLVAFSLLDITQQSGQDRLNHAKAVRRRLQELASELKVKVPVYVVFTKCDLVAGFVEYFDDLGRDDRAQVWGTTFPIQTSQTPGGAVEAFGGEFDALMERLDSRLMVRLDQERDVRRRGAVYGFTQQMGAFKSGLVDFLAEAFQPTRFEEPCLLRGVYFSSGTQEGNPIDRVISSISGSFGLDRQVLPAFSGPGRSYFLTRLLRDVVFQEADLVNNTGFFHKYRPWIQRGAYGTAIAAVIAMTAAWTVSYLGNRDYVATMESEVETYKTVAEALVKGGGTIDSMLEPLDQLRGLPSGYDERDQPVPVSLGLGLYQGDKLGHAARTAYRRALNTILLPRVMEGLEQQITAFSEHPELLYQALKAYLMIGNPKFLEPEFLQFWITLDWDQRLPGGQNAALRERFAIHLAALLETDLNPPPLNGTLVSAARASLANQPVSYRVYADLKQEAQNSLEAWSATDVMGEAANRYFERKSGQPMSSGVPGLFTYSGFTGYFLKKSPEVVQVAVRESWVLGPEYSQRLGELDLANLTSDVTELYLREYGNVWQEYLNDVELASFKGFSDGADLTNALSAPDSPIIHFLRAVTAETALTKTPEMLAGNNSGEPGQFDKIKEQVSKILSLSQKAQAMTGLENPAAMVEQRFARLHALLDASGGPAPVKRIVDLIGDLYAYLRSSIRTGEAGGNEVVNRLLVESGRQPEPVKTWLVGLARQTTALTVRDIRKRLNTAWGSQMAPYCRRAFANRYPLVRGSSQDANINDFARYFGPQGMMDGFISKHIAPFVDTSQRPWKARASGDMALGISDETLRQFERADSIREAFFPSGSATPSVHFQIRPLALTKSVRQVMLQLGGEQRVTYRHGPVRWQPMQWPPPDGLTQARLVFQPLTQGTAPFVKAEGDWALFRLLDKGQLAQTAQADRFKVTFDVQGLIASFEIRASSVINPFHRGTIGGFQCLGNL